MFEILKTCLLRDHNCKGEQVVAGECGGLTVRTLKDGGIEEVEEEIRTRSYLWESPEDICEGQTLRLC